MIKLCVMCEKCSFNEGYFLSEYTHEDPNISCTLNLHNNEAPLKGVLQFHKWNSYAQQCDEFTLPKELEYIKLIQVTHDD